MTKKSKINHRTSTKSKPNTKSKSNSKTNTKSNSKTNTKPTPNTKPIPKSNSKTNTKSNTKSNSKTNTKPTPNTNPTSQKISFIKFLTHLLNNLSSNNNKYLNDCTITMYLSMLSINPQNLTDDVSDAYFAESKMLAKSLYNNPLITMEIYRYIISNKSKISFLSMYSVEQVAYITSLSVSDTKLIACAGSGKTRSVIGRIKFMVEHHFVNKENVFAITFSKHAALDFHEKIKNLFPDYQQFCLLKNFSTIDSLAKSVLCRVKSHKSENVEILSIAFRNYLKSMPITDITTIANAKNIKHLFVDEAQDLNEVQYDILMLLKEKLGTIIHLIGDPNQNIFQFRRSSSSYLINFTGKQFDLTLNFRSSQEIINFSNELKPIATAESRSATNKHSNKVVILTKPAAQIHKIILGFIDLYAKEKDLSNIAIICPTRGIKALNSVGLSVFFNLLKLNNIPFKQFYDENGRADEKKRNTGKIPGHINLITYHGTKGLEFDVVFVMDFYQHLFNRKPTEYDHLINKYLLYVATSRAISLMYVCTYENVHNGYLNHWVTSISPANYVTDMPLKISHLTFSSEDELVSINGITELINLMTDEHLDMVDDIITISEDHGMYTRRIYKDYSSIDRGTDEALFGIFAEELFYLQYYLARNMDPRPLGLLQAIIDSKFVIIEDNRDYKDLKLYINTNKLTWEKFDASRSLIPNNICKLIEKNFHRDTELTDFIVCTNEFVKIIESNIEDIRQSYSRYLQPDIYDYDYEKIIVDFFYLIVVMYAYNNNHYYYITNHGKEKQYLLQNGAELFESINNYALFNYLATEIDPKINVHYFNLMLLGEIDFIERLKPTNKMEPTPQTIPIPQTIETIVEIKCTKEISIKYYLQLLLYNFCYYHDIEHNKAKLFKNSFKIINLLTGLEHYLIIEISPANMFNLLITLAELGNLKFSKLNLVYDLETTDRIKSIGPFDKKPINIPRSDVYTKGIKYIGSTYPEITEISIKDYDTGMVLIDTLVKPSGPIHPEVIKITGIKPDMLVTKPTIDSIRTILEKKMKNFIDYKMLAHNGKCFDDKIILYDKLVDKQNVTFLDTLHIIPMHLPPGMKLESKKLGSIYKVLFGKGFNAHRAMADVDALIEIMQYLKIRF